MKKLILLICLVMALGVVGVVADEGGQNVTVNVTAGINVVISPGTLNFGDLAPGGVYEILKAITFDANGSNLDLDISVLSVTEGLFNNRLDLRNSDDGDYENVNNLNEEMNCIDGDICTYDLLLLDAQLTIPIGTPAGTTSGTITYLITGDEP